jgi:uridine kinase
VRAADRSNPAVVIDGRSGAGKSTLARRVAENWPLDVSVQLVALDSFYPGWDGLAEGGRIAVDEVLGPHSRGESGVWNRWDWELDTAAESHTVDPALGLIVEGCGALTRDAAAVADVRVWVDGPAASRKHRALERDGDGFRPHWDRWAAQEDAHIRAHDPVELASIVVTVP